MLSPCLLLSILFTIARSFSTSRNSGDMRQNPTCEQLREFWDEINQMAQVVEITNEIPILPLRFQNAMDRVHMATPYRNSHRGKSHKKTLKDKSPYFLDITNPFVRYVVPPEQSISSPSNFVLSNQQAPLNEELNGVFGEFHEQVADEQSIGPSREHQATKSSDRHRTKPEVFKLESSPGVPLGNKKNGEVEFFIPQWGSPEDVDTFGGFVDVDFSSPYLPMTRTPKGVKGQWSDISHDDASHNCDAVMNSNCRTKEDCFCKGLRKLTCIHGKCLTHGNHEDMEAKYGIWHDGPIPHSELQLLARRKKRSYKSIFM